MSRIAINDLETKNNILDSVTDQELNNILGLGGRVRLFWGLIDVQWD
jgi:hypothetical protein